MARSRLSDDEIGKALGELDGWSVREGKLTKTFQFADFVAAFGWMTRVALTAEKLDHHPDWKNVYRTVEVVLWTHDVGGLTDLDLRLARAMNEHASR